MKTTKFRSKQFHYDKHGELGTQNNGKVEHCNIIHSLTRWGWGEEVGGTQVGHWWAWRYPGREWRRQGEGVRMSHPGARKSACHKHPKLHTHSGSSIREPLVCLQNVTG